MMTMMNLILVKQRKGVFKEARAHLWVVIIHCGKVIHILAKVPDIIFMPVYAYFLSSDLIFYGVHNIQAYLTS